MAKSFNISPTLKKNTKAEPKLVEKTAFKKTLKDIGEVEKKVKLIHNEKVEKAAVVEKVESRVEEKPVKKTSRKTTKAKAPKTARKGTTIVTADSKRLTVVMPKEIHRRLKIKSINEEITLNELIVNLIEKELG